MIVDIAHFMRRPGLGHHSIEGLFRALRDELNAQGCAAVARTMPHVSKGVWPRLANVYWASRNQGVVNHVTGDIHYAVLGLAPGRTVLTIHDCGGLTRMSGLKRRLFKKFWFDLPMRHVRCITVISEQTRRELVALYPKFEHKIVVIPNAVSPTFKPSPKPFREERPVVLHIGGKPNKNISRLALALRRLPVRLSIVGCLSANDEQRLRECKIDFNAKDGLSEAELYGEYQAADLVCFASTYEGFGMPIIEAQAVERPVITSNCSSMPEVAGDGAYFVDPFDPESIRKGIISVIEDRSLRERLIRNGRENKNRFALPTVASQYMKLYAEVGGSGAVADH